MKLKCPTSKILLPVDGSTDSKRALQFAGYLGTSLSKYLKSLTLLRVLEGGYLSRHMGNIDFRAEDLMQSDTFKRIKEEHIEKDIRPLLDEGEKTLRDLGVKAEIKKLIVDGDPSNEIISNADKGKIFTIIMARKGFSEAKRHFLGSVTSKVVHSAIRQTVYVVGHNIQEDKKCSVPKILIPVDGSQYSMKGIEHASCLTEMLKDSIEQITLLRVINPALNEEKLKKGIVPEEETTKILNEAKEVFLEADISEKIITTKSRTGKPADEILKEAEEGNYNLVIMGRKGRAALKDLILGGVSTTILQRCLNPTVAIVNSE